MLFSYLVRPDAQRKRKMERLKIQRGTKESEKRRSKEINSKTDHAIRKRVNRSKMNQKKGRPCHECDPREGVPVFYLTLQSQSLLFIQRCYVWHFLRCGGSVGAIVFLGCCSNGSLHWNVSSLWLYLFAYLYLSWGKCCLFLPMMVYLVSGAAPRWFVTQWMSSNSLLMDWASFFFGVGGKHLIWDVLHVVIVDTTAQLSKGRSELEDCSSVNNDVVIMCNILLSTCLLGRAVTLNWSSRKYLRQRGKLRQIQTVRSLFFMNSKEKRDLKEQLSNMIIQDVRLRCLQGLSHYISVV